ncbi:type I restriction-modification system subunit M [Metamycoplasma hominis]|uniref:type I restriction-modification system subunit M n=1 Tax=Metamycoplasma hominis TaxID=2098 RepID=UPI000938D889|nr:type I restriction-modification system subunit M [Metamycoplasma hominis]OKL23134.1 type I restriction-modification system subunit M [Metamycoplasma hominis]
MAINNQERDELHKKIWDIANRLRGSIDGWDFKQYVLGIMFYRYISENIATYANNRQRQAGIEDFDYTTLSDEEALTGRDDLINEKGFFILPSELFINVVRNATTNNCLNETLDNIFKNIESSAKGQQSENDFSGLFNDVDVNSQKLGRSVDERNKKLAAILQEIAAMKLGNYQDNSIDAFGDAYEYLMSMYASNAGKSGGEYFTPQEVSELLTKIAVFNKKKVNRVYDPACGSGSLLLQTIKVLGKENIKDGFYGQEVNLTTYNLCRINMFLHDIGFDKFNIYNGDTLLSPSSEHQRKEPFDVIVSNPPYSIKWEGEDNPLLINDQRFSPAGILAPKSKADFAFILHSLSWLATDGVAAIVCFPGIMYRGGAEQKIRQYLVENNFIDAIIQLPSNLFFGTSISTCIMVLKKSKIDNNILFIDASQEFLKVTNNNKLTSQNINNIIDYYGQRKDISYISKLANVEDIKSNSYNLSVNSYVEKQDTSEKIDINVLNSQIKQTVSKIETLRSEIDKIVAELEE